MQEIKFHWCLRVLQHSAVTSVLDICCSNLQVGGHTTSILRCHFLYTFALDAFESNRATKAGLLELTHYVMRLPTCALFAEAFLAKVLSPSPKSQVLCPFSKVQPLAHL